MWSIKYIKANNFFSHKKLEYQLVNNQLTMIYGINSDVSKKKSNGSGKSVLLDAISFAITGDTLRKLKSIKEIINNEEEECYVEIELENKTTKDMMRIGRILSTKSSQKISIGYNHKIQDQLKDLHPRESDKYIQERLGISFDDLLNYYLISKFKYQSLFLASDSVKKEVINRFSKADIVDNIFPHFDTAEEYVEKEIETANEKMVKAKTEIEIYEQQIEDVLLLNSKEKKQEKIKEISNKIENHSLIVIELKNEIKKIEIEIQALLKSIESKKEELINIDEAKWDSSISAKVRELENKRIEYSNVRSNYKNPFELLTKEETECKHLITQYESDIKEYNAAKLDLEKFIAGEIECPKCKHHFILADKEFDVENAKQSVIELEKLKKETEKQLTDVNQFIGRIKTDREGLETKIKNDQNNIQFECDKIKKELDKFENQKRDLTVANNKIHTVVSELERQTVSKINNIKLKEEQIVKEEYYITQSQEDIKQEKNKTGKKEIDEIQKKLEKSAEVHLIAEADMAISIEKQQKLIEWRNKFKRFKSFLANQSISQIQSQANYFLQKMKAETYVFIDGFRELGNGKLKEEITVELSRDGINGESFGKYSGGEKSLADLASILSMQNIINTTSISGGLNFLGIDEILESVDSEGMDGIAKCLSQLNQTIVLIAHSQPDQNIDCNKVIIQKQKGISTILN